MLMVVLGLIILAILLSLILQRKVHKQPYARDRPPLVPLQKRTSPMSVYSSGEIHPVRLVKCNFLCLSCYTFICSALNIRSFSSSFHHFVALKATKWRLFSVGKGLSGVAMWAQRATLSPKREFYGIWSARPEMLLMPKTNFGSGGTENAKPLMSPDVNWHLQQRWKGLGMLWQRRW